MLQDINQLNFKVKTMIKLTTPIKTKDILKLKAGDLVYLTGTIYTARDAAHERLVQAIIKNQPLPIDLQEAIIFYVGPTPAKPGEIIGSAGPTSSYRMDLYSKHLMEKGSVISIGKGPRSEEYIEDLKKYQGLYLSAVGGTGALISKSIKKCDLIAYEDLGAEAIYKLEVEDFQAVVTYDAYGNNLLEEGLKKYQKIHFN